MKQEGRHGRERKRSEAQKRLDFDIKRGKRVCSSCGVEKKFTFDHQRDGKKMFLDDLERYWTGSRCSECSPQAKKRKGTGRWPVTRLA